MKGRRTARRIALDVLYEAEIRGSSPLEAFRGHAEAGWVVAGAGDDPSGRAAPQPGPDALDYALTLVQGVTANRARLDELIAAYAESWTIDRMPLIDRNLVRIALYELLWRDDIPVAVAINEAVELGKSLSTDDSGRFINGLLGRIVERERATP
ncbi:MAG: transcription antitermination factor NusB [Actinomycetota bacterium]